MTKVFKDLLEKISFCDPSFTSIDLSNRGIDDSDIKLIVDTIIESNNDVISHFYLSENNITDEGCRNLSRLTNVIYIDLENNQLGQQSGMHLSSMKSLKKLFLASNKLDIVAFTSLLSSKSLVFVDISNNNVSLVEISTVTKSDQYPITIEFGEHRIDLSSQKKFSTDVTSQSLFQPVDEVHDEDERRMEYEITDLIKTHYSNIPPAKLNSILRKIASNIYYEEAEMNEEWYEPASKISTWT